MVVAGIGKNSVLPNAINSGSEQRAFVAPLFTAGYGERYALSSRRIGEA